MNRKMIKILRSQKRCLCRSLNLPEDQVLWLSLLPPGKIGLSRNLFAVLVFVSPQVYVHTQVVILLPLAVEWSED